MAEQNNSPMGRSLKEEKISGIGSLLGVGATKGLPTVLNIGDKFIMLLGDQMISFDTIEELNEFSKNLPSASMMMDTTTSAFGDAGKGREAPNFDEFKNMKREEARANGGRIGYQTGGITMANTLQQNLAANQAQAANVQAMLNAARKQAGLPSVQTTAAPTPTTSTPAPSITKSSPTPTQTSAPSMQQVTSQMMAPATTSKTYAIPEQSGPGMGPMGPMMTDPLQVFSGLNQQQISELPEQDYLTLEKRFDALPQSEKDNIDKFITTSLDKQAQQFLAKEKADEIKYRQPDGSAGNMGMYVDAVEGIKATRPDVKLTGNETFTELQKIIYPEYFNPDGSYMTDDEYNQKFGSSLSSNLEGSGTKPNLDPVYTMSPSNIQSFLRANPTTNTTRGRYYAGRNQFDIGGRVGYQTGGVTETRSLPPEFVEAAQKTYLTDLSRQAGIPSITTATTQQPGETAQQFANRQAQAQQFQITKAGMAELAPQVAAQDPLQAAAYAQAIDPTKGLGAFQPFLTKAATAADATTALTGTGAGTGVGSIASYTSPFQQQVIDTTLSEFDKQAKMRQNQLAASALGIPGAFGGGREGVQRAEFDATSDANRARILADLRQRGFQQGQQARQQDLANQMSISQLQSGLGGAAQDFSRAQISGLGTLGAQQQAQNQAILDAQRQASAMAVQDPRDRLAMFGQGIAGLSGTSGAGSVKIAPSAVETSTGASPLMTALGVGLAGADIYGRIFGGRKTT